LIAGRTADVTPGDHPAQVEHKGGSAMRKIVGIGGMAGLTLAVALGAIVAGASSNGKPADAERSQEAAAENPVGQDLANARAATARYHQVEQALADGYVPDPYIGIPVCIASPAGAMGIHYLKLSLVDEQIDIEQPEMLLYVPNNDGKLKLVALEYFKPDSDQELATDGDRPTLFGQPFDGPMEGHAGDMPAHYDLHVWLWEHNPAGMFAQWNPRLSCP
jgi:hypothetical protein